MASNKMDGGKCKGAGDVKAALRHNDCSPEMRAIAARGNEHIDVKKSHLNVNLTGDTYEERCAKYDQRIAELDAQPGANKRKDRVTGQKIETPVPAGLPRDKYNDFLRRVLDIQTAMFGAENLIAADIHWDEEHEYIDPETHEKTMSRVHLQTVFVPVRAGKLYGQAVYSRKNIYALNNACQKMAADEFGVDFMTGEGKSSKKTVGQLKAQSEAEAIIMAAREEGAIELQQTDSWVEQIRQEAQQDAQAIREAAGAILSDAKAQAQEIIAEAENVRQRAAEAAERERQALNARRQRLEDWETELEQRETAVGQREQALTATAREFYRRKLEAAQQQRQTQRSEEAALIAPTVTPKRGKRAGKIPRQEQEFS